ncbi:unnamed protein product [Durusdinium trenchii]|uniref:Uncharacterized protein n=1 Tax=Durusdinium trenchii TaxID=1381693 RepID=A0ABP0QX80_9DINO
MRPSQGAPRPPSFVASSAGVPHLMPRCAVQMPKASCPPSTRAVSPPMQNRGPPRTPPQEAHAEVRYRSSPSAPITPGARARHSSVEGIKGYGKGSARLGVLEEAPGGRDNSAPPPNHEQSFQRRSSSHLIPGKGQPPAEARLQYLESELASFSWKMSEMRTAAEALQEEVRTVRPSLDATPGKAPSSAATSMGHPLQSASDEVESDSTSGWVLDALKQVLTGRQGTEHSSSFAPNDMAQELKQLQHDLRLEAEARKQLDVKIESMLLDEKKKRDEAIRQMQVHQEEQGTKLDQRWQNHLKEESSLRRAVESHLEARLTALQREIRLEAGNAANQAEKAMGEFLQMRESMQQELNAQKLEIGNASADLSRLIDEVRTHGSGIKADVAVPSAEITENLVRAEVRRQLAERSPEANTVSSLELQALSSRLERLEQGLANEAASRQEESGKSISMLHELGGELMKTQTQALREFEDTVKTKIDAALLEAQAAQQAAMEEQRLRRQQLSNETKDREDTCMMILKSMEEKISNESKHLQTLLGEQRLHLEQQIRGHDRELQASLEIAVTNFAEKHSKDVVSTRHDLLELREELQEANRNQCDQLPANSQGELQRLVDGQTKLWATLDQVRHDLGEQLRHKDHSHRISLGGGLSPLDIEELRTQLASERLAREQGDDRCMENIRDLVTEEEQKRSRELQALERRLNKTEDSKNTLLAGTRPATTSACPSGAQIVAQLAQPAACPKLSSFSA